MTVSLYLSQVARSTRHVLSGNLSHCTPALAQLSLPSRNITMTASAWTGRTPLEEVDPDILGLIREEKQRQVCGLELIASEVMSLFCTHTHTHHTPHSLSLSLSEFHQPCCPRVSWFLPHKQVLGGLPGPALLWRQ